SVRVQMIVAMWWVLLFGAGSVENLRTVADHDNALRRFASVGEMHPYLRCDLRNSGLCRRSRVIPATFAWRRPRYEIRPLLITDTKLPPRWGGRRGSRPPSRGSSGGEPDYCSGRPNCGGCWPCWLCCPYWPNWPYCCSP